MFNFNKTIEVHCYMYSKYVVDTFNIKPMINHRPSWFKNIPKKLVHNNIERPSFRNCSGYLEMYKQGFYVPLWTDLDIINKVDGMMCDEAYHQLGSLDSDFGLQSLPTLKDHHRNIKIDSPWFVKCDHDIKFLLMGATWDYINNNSYDFQILPGVIDFKYNHSPNVQMLLPIPMGNQRESHIKLKAGEPIMYLFPLTEKKVKFISHTVTEMEHRQMRIDHDCLSPYRKNRYQRGTYKGYIKE